jgi:hypothetical protein
VSDLPEKIVEAAHDIDALPTDRREVVWTLLWQGAVIGTMVLVMEYAVFQPLWRYGVLPLWHWLL